MKKLSYLFICSIIFSLTACTPPSEQVMSPLAYNNTVTMHDTRKADLYWQSGTQLSSEAPPTQDLTDGISGMVINAAVNAEMRSARPGDFTYTYGKAQQAVFMTSLKDALLNQHAFKDVELITDLKDAKPQDVLITIDFKQTQVLGQNTHYQIILNTDMTIKAGNKPPYKRSYVVQSKDPGFFSIKSFKAQQTDASQQLLDKIMGGITQWSAQGH
jgi:hypothetical protein